MALFHGSGPQRRLRPDRTEFEAKKPAQNAPGGASALVRFQVRVGGTVTSGGTAGSDLLPRSSRWTRNRDTVPFRKG
jgi:hypothetical protein